MRVLMDTSAYIELINGHTVVSKLVREAEKVLFSPIVVAELLFGYRLARHFERNKATLHSFLNSANVTFLDVNMTTADRYSRIAASQRAKGLTIPTNDMWIAAHAMETGADLVSADKHFEYVDGIALVPIEAN